ncbi:dynein regulatory complex protein 9 [Hoplias malabaricus]|uniref:dynein regulatory complex protein 9 n=1 Tax=Hoplias malabaricus TaxID=27720 RepID=UPI00346379AE
MSSPLSDVKILRVSAVLQACADQLAVLGNIIPNTSTGKTVMEDDVGLVMESQRAAEHHPKAHEAMQELHISHRELNRTLVESPLFHENMAKVQRDRQFVAEVIKDILAELQEKGTFHSLLKAAEEEKKRRAHLQEIIAREEEGRLRTKALQKQLVDIRKEKTVELQSREELTAHLKDQLQEIKVKTSLEKKYVKSSTDLLVYQGEKLNTQKEKELEEEIRLLQEQLEEEKRVHTEMKSFLKEHQTRLGEKLEYWMERYEKDMEDKQQELNTLNINKANNVTMLQNLARKYRACEQVIIEDRLEKENLCKQLAKEQMERDAATKIQSWWRGTLVRKCLGPYKKGKKAKSKGSKKGKGKGKKK